jgi:hypothetical protein
MHLYIWKLKCEKCGEVFFCSTEEEKYIPPKTLYKNSDLKICGRCRIYNILNKVIDKYTQTIKHLSNHPTNPPRSPGGTRYVP